MKAKELLGQVEDEITEAQEKRAKAVIREKRRRVELTKRDIANSEAALKKAQADLDEVLGKDVAELAGPDQKTWVYCTSTPRTYDSSLLTDALTNLNAYNSQGIV